MSVINSPSQDSPPENTSSPQGSPSQGSPSQGAPSDGSIPVEAGPTANRRGRRRPKRLLVASGCVVALLLVAGGALFLTSTETTEPAESVSIRSVQAETRDLVEVSELDGTLTYASTRTVAAALDGTVTSIAGDGVTVDRGDAVYETNTIPVIAFFGDTPLYRDLTEGMEGDDVTVLENNLAALGYHTFENDDGDDVDTGFSVDGVFDAATTEAVRRWQADIGLAETGSVALSEIVIVSGPSIVSNVAAEVGSRLQTGAPVLDLNMSSGPDAFHSQHTGEIELQVGQGEIIESGTVIYTVDEAPIVAIVVDPTSEVVLDRDLTAGIADGDDVEVLERLLTDLGFDAGGDLEIDDVFDDATADAIREWEEDIEDSYDDFVADGAMRVSDIIAVEPGLRVDEITERESDDTVSGSELFTTSSDEPTRIVKTSIGVAEQDTLAVGNVVDVEFPDGAVASGVVSNRATSSTTDPTDPEAEAMLAVEITIDSIPDSAAALTELNVDVKVVDERAADATVVPASALVVTADGGYAVEVVTGDATTTFVAVEPGMFADGFVEVSGIEPGTAVVVPS